MSMAENAPDIVVGTQPRLGSTITAGLGKPTTPNDVQSIVVEHGYSPSFSGQASQSLHDVGIKVLVANSQDKGTMNTINDYLSNDKVNDAYNNPNKYNWNKYKGGYNAFRDNYNSLKGSINTIKSNIAKNNQTLADYTKKVADYIYAIKGSPLTQSEKDIIRESQPLPTLSRNYTITMKDSAGNVIGSAVFDSPDKVTRYINALQQPSVADAQKKPIKIEWVETNAAKILHNKIQRGAQAIINWSESGEPIVSHKYGITSTGPSLQSLVGNLALGAYGGTIGLADPQTLVDIGNDLSKNVRWEPVTSARGTRNALVLDFNPFIAQFTANPVSNSLRLLGGILAGAAIGSALGGLDVPIEDYTGPTLSDEAVADMLKDRSLEFSPIEDYTGPTLSEEAVNTMRYFSDPNSFSLPSPFKGIDDLEVVTDAVKKSIDDINGPNTIMFSDTKPVIDAETAAIEDALKNASKAVTTDDIKTILNNVPKPDVGVGDLVADESVTKFVSDLTETYEGPSLSQDAINAMHGDGFFKPFQDVKEFTLPSPFDEGYTGPTLSDESIQKMLKAGEPKGTPRTIIIDGKEYTYLGTNDITNFPNARIEIIDGERYLRTGADLFKLSPEVQQIYENLENLDVRTAAGNRFLDVYHNTLSSDVENVARNRFLDIYHQTPNFETFTGVSPDLSLDTLLGSGIGSTFKLGMLMEPISDVAQIQQVSTTVDEIQTQVSDTQQIQDTQQIVEQIPDIATITAPDIITTFPDTFDIYTPPPPPPPEPTPPDIPPPDEPDFPFPFKGGSIPSNSKYYMDKPLKRKTKFRVKFMYKHGKDIVKIVETLSFRSALDIAWNIRGNNVIPDSVKITRI